MHHLADFRQRGHGGPALGELSISDAPLYETVELEFLSRINFCSRVLRKKNRTPRFWLKPEAICGMIATSCLLPASSFG